MWQIRNLHVKWKSFQHGMPVRLVYERWKETGKPVGNPQEELVRQYVFSGFKKGKWTLACTEAAAIQFNSRELGLQH